MKIISIAFILTVVGGICHANEVTICRGTSDLDGSSVSAIVSVENGTGQIVMTTSIDSTTSSTKIEILPNNAFRVFDNSYQMDFTIAPGLKDGPIEAFRGGEFFVDDFICTGSN